MVLNKIIFIYQYPAGNYMFRVDNRNTRVRCEICSKLTNTRQRQWRPSDVFVVNFEHISHLVLSIVNFEHVIIEILNKNNIIKATSKYLSNLFLLDHFIVFFSFHCIHFIVFFAGFFLVHSFSLRTSKFCLRLAVYNFFHF